MLSTNQNQIKSRQKVDLSCYPVCFLSFCILMQKQTRYTTATTQMHEPLWKLFDLHVRVFSCISWLVMPNQMHPKFWHRSHFSSLRVLDVFKTKKLYLFGNSHFDIGHLWEIFDSNIQFYHPLSVCDKYRYSAVIVAIEY